MYDQPLSLRVNPPLLFDWMATYVAPAERLPNAYEIIHYPWLLAGFLALFFTALNLIPIGQLDGGHILYGLIGYRKPPVGVGGVVYCLYGLRGVRRDYA